MPTFLMQAGGRSAAAFTARGSNTPIRLNSAADAGIHAALIDLTVVDVNDTTKRCIPAYFIEACYLRVTGVREGDAAHDVPISSSSMSVAGMERIETLLLAAHFDFSK